YEAELVAWHVRPGETVKRGQNLLEVMTDKATMEVPAPFAGRIDGLRAEVGRQLKIGDLLLTYTAAGQPEPAEVGSPVASAPGERSVRPTQQGEAGRVGEPGRVSAGSTPQNRGVGGSLPALTQPGSPAQPDSPTQPGLPVTNGPPTNRLPV